MFAYNHLVRCWGNWRFVSNNALIVYLHLMYKTVMIVTQRDLGEAIELYKWNGVIAKDRGNL